MPGNELAQRFLEKAKQDLCVLEKWRGDAEIADEVIGFHAQQAAEKLLKAALANAVIEFPFTHQLTILIDALYDHGIMFPEELDKIRYLTPFAVQFRYEFFEEDDEPLDRDDVFTLLNQLSAWVERQLVLPVDDQIEATPQSNLQPDSKEDAHNNDTV